MRQFVIKDEKMPTDRDLEFRLAHGDFGLLVQARSVGDSRWIDLVGFRPHNKPEFFFFSSADIALLGLDTTPTARLAAWNGLADPQTGGR